MMSLACAMRGIHNVGGLTKNGHDLSWRGTEWGVPCMKTHRLGRRAGGRGSAPFYHGYKRRLSTRPVVRRLIGVGKMS
ncbi:adenylate kinase 4-like [Iris pallida]|uniref:Adenylate kinase 4-like n=1 Tax=Iris pallida TaxID=29817 RepID=A0AAX6E6Y5_IRIPA|nr:adenylate kinase 4-like [Iris pallida]